MKTNFALHFMLTVMAAPIAVIAVGGFLETCCAVNIDQSVTILSAEGKTRSGQLMQSSLNLNDCIANKNGQLVPAPG